MEDILITIEDSALKARVESLLENKDIVFSLTAPTVSSPFPLWIWKDIMKLWIGDRWINVGVYRSKDHEIVRTANGLIRLKE